MREFLPCFTPGSRMLRGLCREGKHGYRISAGHHRVFAGDAGIGRGMRRAGAKKMTWAYVLSGAIAVALLVYLVVALIRAEDL